MRVILESKWLKPIRSFDDTQRLEIYDAIFDYMEGNKLNLSEKSEVAFSMLKPMLDTQKEKLKKGKKEDKETKLFEVEEFRSEKLKSLDGWMEKYTPYIYHNITPLTQKEFDSLLIKYGIKSICDTLQQIENRKDLRKRYTSLYRTLLNWLKDGS